MSVKKSNMSWKRGCHKNNKQKLYLKSLLCDFASKVLTCSNFVNRPIIINLSFIITRAHCMFDYFSAVLKKFKL